MLASPQFQLRLLLFSTDTLQRVIKVATTVYPVPGYHPETTQKMSTFVALDLH